MSEEKQILAESYQLAREGIATLDDSWQGLLDFVDHWSASSATMADRCLEQWRHRYILNLKEKPGAALILGGAYHKAIETNLRQKITSYLNMELSDVQDAYATAWDDKIEQEGGAIEIEWGHDKPASVKDTGYKITGAYHTKVAPLVQPIKVEKKFSLDLPQIKVPIIGFIDTETERSIIDHKTSRASLRSPKPDWRIQGDLYQMSTQKPVEWQIAVKSGGGHILTSKEEPELRVGVDAVRLRTTHEYLNRIFTQIVEAFTKYGPDNPWPGALTHPWACGYCGYQPRCHWHGNAGKKAA